MSNVVDFKKKAKATKITGILDFHGLDMMVVTYEGVEYIYAKPLSDLAGMAWRRTKTTLVSQNNAILYGTNTLQHPILSAEVDHKVTPPEGIYIRLDRARMFLARVNTSRMAANGNAEEAENLLKLQIEWAAVLHSYETTGVAVKNNRLDVRQKEEKNLAALIKTRKEMANSQEKAALTSMIHDKLTELGYPPDAMEDKQLSLV